METEPCTDCHEMTFTSLTEPDGKPMRFDARPVRGWRMTQITPNHSVGVPTEVHMPHVLSCKAINKQA